MLSLAYPFEPSLYTVLARLAEYELYSPCNSPLQRQIAKKMDRSRSACPQSFCSCEDGAAVTCYFRLTLIRFMCYLIFFIAFNTCFLLFTYEVSRLCELCSWAHIRCTLNFVLKIGCDNKGRQRPPPIDRSQIIAS